MTSGQAAQRLAIVTGGGRGIGKAIARALAADGYELALLDRDAEAGQAVAADLAAVGATATFRQIDVRDRRQIKDAFAAVEAESGLPCALVNNAGIYPDASLLDTSEDLWDDVLDINLKGAFFCAQSFARSLSSRGRPGAIVPGAIVNVASTAAFSARAGASHYAASKAGLVMLTKSLAQELGDRGIRCNAVAPGLIDVGAAQVSDDYRRSYVTKIPLGRAGMAEEVAQVVAFLLSPSASYVNGACIPVDGGFLAGRDLNRSGSV